MTIAQLKALVDEDVRQARRASAAAGGSAAAPAPFVDGAERGTSADLIALSGMRLRHPGSG